jgi:hypothetical protein
MLFSSRLFLLLILEVLLTGRVRGVTNPQLSTGTFDATAAALTDDPAAYDDAAYDDAPTPPNDDAPTPLYDDAYYYDDVVVPTRRPTKTPTRRPTRIPVAAPTRQPNRPPTTKPPRTQAPTFNSVSSARLPFRVEVAYDSNPDEFSWKIKDKTTREDVVFYPKKLGISPNKTIRLRLRLTAGHKYKLTARDRSGDGLIQGYITVEVLRNGQWSRVGKLSGRFQQETLEFDA